MTSKLTNSLMFVKLQVLHQGDLFSHCQVISLLISHNITGEMNNICDFAEPHCRPNILTLGYSNPLPHCKSCSGSAGGSDKEVKMLTWPPNSPDPNMIKHHGDVIEQLQFTVAPHWVRLGSDP